MKDTVIFVLTDDVNDEVLAPVTNRTESDFADCAIGLFIVPRWSGPWVFVVQV